MKKLEISQELPKWDTDMNEVSKCCWKMVPIDFFATNLQIVKKKTVSVKPPDEVYLYASVFCLLLFLLGRASQIQSSISFHHSSI